MGWDARKFWIAVLGATAVLAGCDDGEVEPARVKHCRAVCAQLEMCIRETDEAECEERCDQQEFRSDLYYEVKASCVQSLSCNEWNLELDSRGEDLCTDEDSCTLAACVRSELARKEVSEEQEQYCTSLANKIAPCEDLDATELAQGCEDRLLELSPEYADKTKACVLDLACAEMSPCLEDLADMYGTDLKVFAEF